MGIGGKNKYDEQQRLKYMINADVKGGKAAEYQLDTVCSMHHDGGKRFVERGMGIGDES